MVFDKLASIIGISFLPFAIGICIVAVAVKLENKEIASEGFSGLLLFLSIIFFVAGLPHTIIMLFSNYTLIEKFGGESGRQEDENKKLKREIEELKKELEQHQK